MPLSSNGFPVLLSFDIDAETMWTGRDPKNAERPIVMSQGAYGWKVGVPRILDLLGRYGLRVTFFVPGLVMEQRPAMVEAILPYTPPLEDAENDYQSKPLGWASEAEAALPSRRPSSPVPARAATVPFFRSNTPI